MGRKSCCLLCPYTRSQTPGEGGGAQKLGQRVSQSPSLHAVCVSLPACTRRSLLDLCAHLVLAGSQSCGGGTFSEFECMSVRSCSASELCNSQQMTTWGDVGFTWGGGCSLGQHQSALGKFTRSIDDAAQRWRCALEMYTLQSNK